jgi:hypothetical protein
METVKNTSMFSTPLALPKPLIWSHSLQKKKKSAHYLLHSAMYTVNIKPTHTVYHPVQKVSDLRPGKKSCVPGGAQFLIPFKVGPL